MLTFFFFLLVFLFVVLDAKLTFSLVYSVSAYSKWLSFAKRENIAVFQVSLINRQTANKEFQDFFNTQFWCGDQPGKLLNASPKRNYFQVKKISSLHSLNHQYGSKGFWQKKLNLYVTCNVCEFILYNILLLSMKNVIFWRKTEIVDWCVQISS